MDIHFTWTILTSSLLGFEVRLWVNWGIIGIEFEFLLDTDQNDSKDQSIFVTNGRANNFCECLREHVQPLSVKQFENQRIYIFEHSIRYAGGVSF